MGTIEIGLGLLSIGRPWGVAKTSPPDIAAAVSLIVNAYQHGIRFFDTAPAYARSEEILGMALSSDLVEKSDITVATKMGEYWDFESCTSFTDHSYGQLVKGIDRSIDLLGQIDILQLHKADIGNIASNEVLSALEHAERSGIKRFGVSVKDIQSARLACDCGRYDFIQFPYSLGDRRLEEVFDLVRIHGMQGIVNRPFAMGLLVNGPAQQDPKELFQFILRREFSGIILTGTSSELHLADNIAAFRKARLSCG